MELLNPSSRMLSLRFRGLSASGHKCDPDWSESQTTWQRYRPSSVACAEVSNNTETVSDRRSVECAGGMRVPSRRQTKLYQGEFGLWAARQVRFTGDPTRTGLLGVDVNDRSVGRSGEKGFVRNTVFDYYMLKKGTKIRKRTSYFWILT